MAKRIRSESRSAERSNRVTQEKWERKYGYWFDGDDEFQKYRARKDELALDDTRDEC